MQQIRLYDVTARDGLQNEKSIVPLAQKIELISALVEAGYRDIEISSFVRPSWIPQLADSDQLAQLLPPPPEGVRYWSLVPNRRGLERALDCGVQNIATFMSASETHNRKNVNRTQRESLSSLKEVIETAKAEEMMIS